MRVLLVEDEPRLAETVRRGLTLEGFVVEVAATGPDGARLGLAQEWDVVVLDVMLPGLNGYDVLKTIRAGGVRTPVLMLTAKDGDLDEVDAFDLGADDWLTKPFSFVVLVARLRALVRRGGADRPPELVAGDLVLDPARHRVTRAGEEVSLTPREYGLLQFLLLNTGVVLTKSEILRGVWDAHHEGDENVVEVYVGYLRRKVDTPFGRSSIRTVRGAGYVLVADD
ncbi:response regulator transcription factor [Rhodococcus aerolatus]